MQVESAPPVERPEEIYCRVFKALKPRTPVPEVHIEFCPFANPDSYARLADGRIQVRITDLLQGAPSPVLEALAYILLGKLLRRPVPPAYGRRYRLYLNRRDMRRTIQIVRQLRGRKFVSGARGKHHDLDAIFDDLNFRFFGGLMAKPLLGWSRQPSRTTLGHYDPSHNAIIISRLLDSRSAPLLAVEYVVYHEMLHLRFPTEVNGARRRIHTREFKTAEKEFPGLTHAKELLKRI